MAKKIYEEHEFTLMNDVTVVVRPLPIKPLRKFMEEWQKIQAMDKDATEVDLVDIMFDCAYIVISTFNEEVTKNDLEDALDMKTMERVLAIGGGIQTGEDVDPKMRV